MIKMPGEIKQKLRELDKLSRQANEIENGLNILFLSYGVDPDVFKGLGKGNVKTEAFVHIVNCQGDIEKNIKDIERVFAHYIKGE